jgi:hypothetical protein
MSQLEQTLQERERFRIQVEQLIHPMRDKLEQARLQEQEKYSIREGLTAFLSLLPAACASLPTSPRRSQWGPMP